MTTFPVYQTTVFEYPRQTFSVYQTTVLHTPLSTLTSYESYILPSISQSTKSPSLHNTLTTFSIHQTTVFTYSRQHSYTDSIDAHILPIVLLYPRQPLTNHRPYTPSIYTTLTSFPVHQSTVLTYPCQPY